jgi:hypothetical protein
MIVVAHWYELENIEHSTFNAEHPMGIRHAISLGVER